ncbi:MAG TPA: metallophosphoesterase [Vicinamibacterales bacterium]|nr:metallophosphoesterase [Vicinamibacterales bacterium]
MFEGSRLSARLALLSSLVVVAFVVACQMSPEPQAPPAQVQAPSSPAEEIIPLPNLPDSLKFAVLGDFGTGSTRQYEMGARMAEVHTSFPYELVITVGDNIYGGESLRDMQNKFEKPYKGLLDRNVKFYASLGNHDLPEQRFYKLFNMDGNRYYTVKAPKESVRFFALDSTYMVPEQLTWIENELKGSNDDWKIAYFHHPLYSSGERHGSETELRKVLEPLFIRYNVSVVFAGHDHFYERLKPQEGIAHFVVGSGGQLRVGNIDRNTGLTARGFDTDLAFLVCEIKGDQMTFQALARSGRIVDSGTITRRIPAGSGS